LKVAKIMLNARKNKAAREEDAKKLAELQAKTAARLERISVVDKQDQPMRAPLEETDKRSFLRIVADYPAIVICEEEHDTPATIVDFSEIGMRLRFATEQTLPDTVVIDSPGFTNFIVADVVWRKGAEIGLAVDREWTDKLAAPLESLE